MFYFIRPYRKNGCLVFDDPERGIFEEELCRGADILWERLLAISPTARAILFTSETLRGPADSELVYQTTEADGWHFYLSYGPGPTLEVRLCPTLLHYFPKPPLALFVVACACDPFPQKQMEGSEAPAARPHPAASSVPQAVDSGS